MSQTAAEIIDACGGNKAVIELTGLTKGRISQWRTENHIPRPWLRYLQKAKPGAFRNHAKRRNGKEAHVP